MAVAFEIGVMLVFHFEIPATTSTCMAAVGSFGFSTCGYIWDLYFSGMLLGLSCWLVIIVGSKPT